MFYDPREFKFLTPFIENVHQIAAELAQGVRNVPQIQEFMYHDNPEVSSHMHYWRAENELEGDPRIGVFGTLPLLKEVFPVKWYDAPGTFPTVFKHLAGVEGFYSAFLFRLAAHSQIREHVHSQRNLIFHLCLTETNGPCFLFCNGEKRDLRAVGDSLVFDYTKPHSTSNEGTADRVCLVIDFKNPF